MILPSQRGNYNSQATQRRPTFTALRGLLSDTISLGLHGGFNECSLLPGANRGG